jgi:hypothetical protein
MLALLCAACTQPPEPPPPMTHDAYVWQRRWTPALRDALREARPVVRAWRILGAQIGTDGQVITAGVDLDAVRGSGRPVVVVVRIDGQIATWDDGPVIDTALSRVQVFRRAGVQVVGVEIDHDCANRRLRAYASFLGRFRDALASHGPLELSVTMLPAWLGDDAFAAVLGNVDEVVLQAHSVLNPERGLFDVALARSWVSKLTALNPASFRVALPTYGHRVGFDADGLAVVVESESPRGLAGMRSRELFASPELMSRFVGDLRQDPPRAFSGIAWFRLPTRDDRRAWSLGTWKAVIEGEATAGTVAVRAVTTDTPGTFDLLVVNEAAIHRELPRAFEVVDGGCEVADALAHYRLDPRHRRFHFLLDEPALLAANERRLVGWVRCAQEVIDIDVHPD